MKILSIETSCDETAISLLDSEGAFPDLAIRVLGNGLLSQIDLHTPMGGVVPMLAKREHGRNLVPLLVKVLDEAGMLKSKQHVVHSKQQEEIEKILEREPELLEQFLSTVMNLEKPSASRRIDAIAVTSGPGLEPALWVGINFARALGVVWNIPVIPINHMEGHLISSVLGSPDEGGAYQFPKIEFPALGLLISGGHTEIVLVRDWMHYEVVGETRDDAVGEAFDKVARLLGLPYPGGPEISKLAERGHAGVYKLPRPMLDSDDLDFSFSGLKTAVLYMLKKMPEVSEQDKADIATEFERSVVDVLTGKMRAAIDQFGAKTIILGGGVSANRAIRKVFDQIAKEEFPDVALYIPEARLTTDNAIMIGLAGLMRAGKLGVEKAAAKEIVANGSMRLSKIK